MIEPKEFADEIPKDWLAEIRTWASDPPVTPEAGKWFYIGSGRPHETAQRQQREEYFTTAWIWHRYLFPDSVKTPT